MPSIISKSSILLLFPLLFTTMVFISTSTSFPLLGTYNFNQPIQLLKLLKMDPRRQMVLARLSDFGLKRHAPAERQTDSSAGASID
ncbi:hypothetical protein niasHS_016041 [Heterodera schachtii]|uniref:Uncharacterized protein n=1 Tax=Heterodera schachtii TaxID=97005 RepID=A0ABD2HV37_HETSC